jgi:hypothetical protein
VARCGNTRTPLVPGAVKNWLNTPDTKVICTRPAESCDMDHVIPFADAPHPARRHPRAGPSACPDSRTGGLAGL